MIRFSALNMIPLYYTEEKSCYPPFQDTAAGYNSPVADSPKH